MEGEQHVPGVHGHALVGRVHRRAPQPLEPLQPRQAETKRRYRAVSGECMVHGTTYTLRGTVAYTTY